MQTPDIFRRIGEAWAVLIGRQQGDTQRGATVPSPLVDRHTRKWVQPSRNRRYYRQIDERLARNPMLDFALQQFCRGAVGDKFTITIDRAPTDETAAAADRICRRIIEAGHLLSQAANYAEDLGKYGNHFNQRVVSRDLEIVDILRMPPEGMERLSDDCDQFADPKRAFLQRDAATMHEIGAFALWQIGHGRHRCPRGTRYGRSIVESSLDVAQNAMESALELWKSRRNSRSTDVHNFAPGAGMLDDKLALYINETSKRRILERGEYPEDMRDLYIVGGQINRLPADPNTDKIQDIELQFEVALGALGTSPQQISFDRNANVGVLNERYRQLYANQASFAGEFTAEVLSPLFTLGFALAGIDPRSVEYTVGYGQRFLETDLLARNKEAREDYKAGRIDRKTAVKVGAAFYGERPETILTYLEEEDAAPRRRAAPSESPDPATDEQSGTDGDEDLKTD